MNDIIIVESKSKSVGLSISSIIMLILSIFVLMTGITDVSMVYIIIGIISTFYFGIFAVFIIKRTIKTITSKNKAPLLIINDEGITDISTMTSAGFIAWNEIKSVRMVRMLSVEFIGIEVNNLDVLMNRISFVKRNAMKVNLKMKCSHINISLNTSELKIDKVLNIIMARLDAYNTRECP